METEHKPLGFKTAIVLITYFLNMSSNAKPKIVGWKYEYSMLRACSKIPMSAAVP